MPQRVVIGRMRQRADDGPLLASLGQTRQMLANLNARRLGRGRIELASDIGRCIGLEVKALVLRQSAGEEDVDARLGGPLRPATRRRGPQRGDVIHPQPEQPDRPSLDCRPPRETGVVQSRASDWLLHGEHGRNGIDSQGRARHYRINERRFYKINRPLGPAGTTATREKAADLPSSLRSPIMNGSSPRAVGAQGNLEIISVSDPTHSDSATPGGRLPGPADGPIATELERPRFSLPPTSSKPTSDSNGHIAAIPPLRLRELAAVAAAVVLCDLTVYRGHGFAGYAALIAGLPLLLFLGAPRPTLGWRTWLLGGMLLLLAAKLVWCGSGLAVAIGLALLVTFAMALSGQMPHVLEAIAFGGLAIVGGAQGMGHYGRSLTRESFLVRLPWIEVLLPALALVLFGGIFVLANPDLVTSVSQTADGFFTIVSRWLAHFSVLEIVFWGAVIWLIVGLLRPALSAAPIRRLPLPSPAARHSPRRSTALTATRC